MFPDEQFIDTRVHGDTNEDGYPLIDGVWKIVLAPLGNVGEERYIDFGTIRIDPFDTTVADDSDEDFGASLPDSGEKVTKQDYDDHVTNGFFDPVNPKPHHAHIRLCNEADDRKQRLVTVTQFENQGCDDSEALIYFALHSDRVLKRYTAESMLKNAVQGPIGQQDDAAVDPSRLITFEGTSWKYGFCGPVRLTPSSNDGGPELVLGHFMMWRIPASGNQFFPLMPSFASLSQGNKDNDVMRVWKEAKESVKGYPKFSEN